MLFFAGCDFNCPNCNTSNILFTKDEFLVDLKDIKKEMKNSLGTTAVVFTGGEPCLQRQALLTLASFAKDINLKTGLETNGSKTECIRSLLSLGIIDFIALDIKAPFEEELFEKATKSKTFFKTTASIMTDLKNTLKLLKQYQDKVEIEIRTTITPTLVARKEEILKIAQAIEGLECTWILQQFNPQNVTNKRFSSIKPPSAEFLENLRKTVHKKYPNIRFFVESRLF